MTEQSDSRRVDYDRIAHLYDEPGRDYDVDPHLAGFLNRRGGSASPALRVLDIGCGTGKQLAADRTAFPALELTGLDPSAGMLARARRRCKTVQWVQGDGARLPFEGGRFDYLTSQFSYHHLADKAGLLGEACRVLKPGGRLVITNLDPWSMPGWIVYRYFPAAWQRDLSDFLPIARLRRMMEAAGFRDVRVEREHVHSREELAGFLRYALQRHRTSQLMAIPEERYREGLEAIKRDLARPGEAAAVPSELCLVRVTGDKGDPSKG